MTMANGTFWKVAAITVGLVGVGVGAAIIVKKLQEQQSERVEIDQFEDELMMDALAAQEDLDEALEELEDGEYESLTESTVYSATDVLQKVRDYRDEVEDDEVMEAADELDEEIEAVLTEEADKED